MYGSSTRMRMEQEAERRSNASIVVSAVLSLVVVGLAIAAVAYLVLREPSSAVDSAERLEPVGTALPAPTEVPALPTAVPTREPEPEPTALGFSGNSPPAAGLPTVAAVAEEAGPTPTPRVIDLPTAVPTVPPPPPPTLPPAAPANEVPVVALQPVEAAPPPQPTAAPVAASDAPRPAPTPSRNDSDPFNIFDDTSESRIVPALDDPLQRVREVQDGRNNGDAGSSQSGSNDRNRDDPVVIPTIAVAEIVVPTPDIPPIARSADSPIVSGRNGNDPVQIVMPDVDAMIDDITARTLDPNRNPNVGDAGRRVTGRDDNDSDTSSSSSRRKSSKDRDKDRTPTPVAPGVPNIVPSVPRVEPHGGQGQNQAGCDNPFAALPADKQPKDWPFDDC